MRSTLKDELTKCREERDELQQEVIVLRACVSSHLHGTAQELANAYARLRSFDKARAERTGDGSSCARD